MNKCNKQLEGELAAKLSAQGLPPSSIDRTRILDEMALDSSDLRLVLIQNLATHVDIVAQTVEDSDFVTLEGIVSLMQDNLPNIATLDKTYFDRQGVLPLAYIEEDRELVLGIKTKIRSEKIEHDCLTIANSLGEAKQVLGLDGKTQRETNLVLTDNEFQQMLEMVYSADGRDRYLGAIDWKDSARDNFFNILRTAILKRASDIHIEPIKRGSNRIRYRIDGVLTERAVKIPQKAMTELIAAVKILCDLDTTEKRAPQDGAIHFDEEFIAARPWFEHYHMRVSTVPTNLGEKAVIRLLNDQEQQFDLKSLGFPEPVYLNLKKRTHSPEGIVLVTGPTGSGKTTTLYSALKERNSPKINIVTIEDPVEIDLEGINQTQVNPHKDYSFANALRTLLRQDPDVMLVGEIRDKETAQMAIEAANTGHLVLSTLHTNDAVLSIKRLQDLGIDFSNIADCLKAVLAQRLIRTNCDLCTHEYDAREELSELLGYEIQQLVLLSKGFGEIKRRGHKEEQREGPEYVTCIHCNGESYKGRTAISELFIVTPEVRRLITKEVTDPEAYRKLAIKQEMIPLVQDGFEKVLRGQTTIEELLRVVPRESFVEYKQLLFPMLQKYILKSEAAVKSV